VSVKMKADFLFGVQVVLTIFFCIGQFRHMLIHGTENISMAMFLCIEVFLGINLVLALRAHHVQPSRVTRHGIGIYTIWIILWGANLMLALFKGTSWDGDDAATLALVALGVGVVLYAAKMRGTGIQNPLVRGYLSLAIKAIPQFAQAWKIVAYGGAPGLGWVMVWVGHATILTRVLQIKLALKEAKLEKNRVGLFVSEIGNEVSWIAATVAWLVY